MEKVKCGQRSKVGSKQSGVGAPFAITSHTKIKKIAQIMKKLEHLLNQDESTKWVSTPLPMVSYRSAKKLRSYLVRIKLWPLQRKRSLGVAIQNVKFVLTLKRVTRLQEPLQVNHLRSHSTLKKWKLYKQLFSDHGVPIRLKWRKMCFLAKILFSNKIQKLIPRAYTFCRNVYLKKSTKIHFSLTWRHCKKCKICVTIRTFNLNKPSQLPLRSSRSRMFSKNNCPQKQPSKCVYQ